MEPYYRQDIARVEQEALDQPSPPSKLGQILSTVLPMLAAAAAYRKGALGSYMQGVGDVQDRQQRYGQIAQAQAFRQTALDRQERAERRLSDADRRRAAAEQREAEIAAQQRRYAELKYAVEKALLTPGALKRAEDFRIGIPGLGESLNLAQAMTELRFFRDAQGDWAAPEPEVEEPDLVPQPGPSNTTVYGPKVAGAPVVYPPREPREPQKDRLALREKLDARKRPTGEYVIVNLDTGEERPVKKPNAVPPPSDRGATVPGKKIGRFTIIEQ